MKSPLENIEGLQPDTIIAQVVTPHKDQAVVVVDLPKSYEVVNVNLTHNQCFQRSIHEKVLVQNTDWDAYRDALAVFTRRVSDL